jgi:hypothetical protein
MIVSLWRLPKMRNSSYKSRKENQNIHFTFNNFFWYNVEKYGTASQATDDNIIRRMRSTCSVNKATDPLTAYATFLLFHGNNGYAKAPRYYVVRNCLSCLFWLVHKVMFIAVLRILTHDERFLKTSTYFMFIMDQIRSRLRSVTCLVKSTHKINIVV